MNGHHVFVDETKAHDYPLVAATLHPSEVTLARRVIRDLTLRGQPRRHMKKESDSRKRAILHGIVGLHPVVTIYRAGAHEQVAALCLERDATLVSRDRHWIIEATRVTGAHDLVYRHEAVSFEPALAIPDAIAWAWARGGDWQRRCREVVVREVKV